MTMENWGFAMWGLTTVVTGLTVYFKTQHDTEKRIQHVEDVTEKRLELLAATKADKNNGLSDVKEIVVRIETKVDEQGNKIETIFDKAPCFQPSFKKGDCE